MITALTLPQRAAVALGTAEHEIKLIALAKESADIVAVTNTAGRDQAHRIGMNLRTTRTTIQKIGKDARDDATKFSKAIISEEDRLIAIIQPEEARVIGLRDSFDAEERARKDALIAAERARVDGIQAAITAIRHAAITAAGMSTPWIADRLEFMRAEILSADFFQEFEKNANSAHVAAIGELEILHSGRVVAEAEAARIKQDREAAEAQAKREREELAAAQAKLRADQEAIAEQQRITKAAQDAAKLESDRAAAVLKAAQDELSAKIAAHEAKIASDARAAQKLIDDAAHAELMAESLRIDKASRELAAAQRMEAASVPVEAVAVATAPISTIEPITAQGTEAPTLTLGKIGSRLGFSLTADFLRSIGFEPAGRERAAVLYRESDFARICAALVQHIASIGEFHQLAA